MNDFTNMCKWKKINHWGGNVSLEDKTRDFDEKFRIFFLWEN